MSKESYIRGFVKAAQAMGVDPHALAKYAQAANNVQKVEAAPKYKTDGWAPQVVNSIGKDRAPLYGYDDEGDGKPSIQLVEKAYPIEAANEVQDALRVGKGGDTGIVAAEPRAAIDPIYSAWLNAHMESLGDINKKLAPFFPAKSEAARFSKNTPNPSLAESIARAYQDNMAKLTGAVSRVSAPAKK